MTTISRPVWKIEIKTGDSGESRRYPEWLELRGFAKRYTYVDREAAERALETFRRTQPHGQFRIAPL